jgi:transcriptional regulator with XRE-family HTH domain
MAAQRGMDLRMLERRAGLRRREIEELVDGSVEEPSDHVLDALGRALDIPPSFFFEYRLRAVSEALHRDAPRLNELFLQALTPLEQMAISMDGTTNVALAPAVSRLLVEQQLTQGELAEDIGLSQGYISRLLRERFPDPAFLEMVALALGVEPHYFREYRSKVVADEFRRCPATLNALFDELGDPLALAPYVGWIPCKLPLPEEAELKQLLATIVEIVRAEGPVLGRRLYDLIVGASGCDLTASRRSYLNKAAAALVRQRILADDNETGEPTQIDRVLRLPDTAPVVPRRRGPRRLREVPLRELATVAQAALTTRRLKGVDELQEVLGCLYDVEHPSSAECEHINRAITRVLRST